MTPYALIIGLIMYAMQCSRPNISYALTIMRRYQLDLSKGQRGGCQEYPQALEKHLEYILN